MRQVARFQRAVSAVAEWLVDSTHALLSYLYITLLFKPFLMNTLLGLFYKDWLILFGLMEAVKQFVGHFVKVETIVH